MKTKNILLICILLLATNLLYPQDFMQGKLYVRVQDESAIPEFRFENGLVDIILQDEDLRGVMLDFEVYSFERAFPIIDSVIFNNKYNLDRVYLLECAGDEAGLMNTLNDLYSHYYDLIELIPIPVLAYTPNDYHLLDNILDPNYALDIINAKDAWEITKGDESVLIGIIDTGFWTEHEDLSDNIAIVFANSTDQFHGTAVASNAAATTDNDLGMSSIGFKCKLALDSRWGTHQDGYLTMLNMATQGVKIINCSWVNTGYNPLHQDLIHAITDLGTQIIAAAGNGNFPGYPFGNAKLFPASYDRVISVSSVGPDMKHVSFFNGLTHTHNDKVDICAPGYEIIYASMDPNVNYYWKGSGTSHASPIVAGLAGLLRSVNPTLTPAELTEYLKLTAQPILDEHLFPGLLGAGVIDAHAAVELAANCPPIFITGTETWTEDEVILCGLVIEPGAELTIQSTVRFSQRAKLVVKRGGKLIIDGGVLSNLDMDNKLWPGIELWGNSELSQIPPSNQGWVQMINDGTIENARIGIKTYRPLDDGESEGNPLYGYTGGIIQANQAIFRNNRTAVEMLPYSYANNISYFKKCTFVTDNALADYTHPEYFIKLFGVQNVDFIGCVFKNEIVPTPFSNPKNRGGAIFASNADIIIKDACEGLVVPCPEPDIIPNQFINLYRGIYGLGTGPARNVSINGAKFIENYKGVYLSALDFARITQCEFSVIPATMPHTPEYYGMFVEHSTGYLIEENDFYGMNPGARSGIGLVIDNSGGDDNMVYRNIFYDLEVGAAALNNNKHIFIPAKGLCFKCNDFVNNTFDIFISSDNPTQLDQGIAAYQGAYIPGDNRAPAGNTFTQNQNTSDFNNGTDNHVTYFMHDNNSTNYVIEPIPYHGPVTVTSVPNTEYFKEYACPPNLGGNDPPVEEEKMLLAGLMADSVSYELGTLVDDGDTEILNTNVSTASQTDVVNRYNELLQTSPFISDTVLKTTITREDVFNNEMIRDIMAANPHAPKSELVMQMLENKIDPLPESMMNEIFEGFMITGLKEVYEAQLSHHSKERYQAFSNLYRLYINDPGNPGFGETLETLLMNANYLHAFYTLAYNYLENGNQYMADQTLGEIPGSFELIPEEMEVYLTHQDYFDTWVDLMNDTVFIVRPGNNIISNLLSLYSSGTGVPSVYARNLLISANEIEYNESINLNNYLKNQRFYRKGIQGETTNHVSLNLFPNPASGIITIEFEAEPDAMDLNLLISDIIGNPCFSMDISTNKGLKQISVDGFKPGVYFVSLVNASRVLVTKRLMIIN
jgi:hypothetical protein